MEHFVDILTTFINDVNKSHHIFGKPTNEESTLADNKLMCESLLNYGFRGTTLSYEELIIAIGEIVDRTTTVSNLTERERHERANGNCNGCKEVTMMDQEKIESRSQQGQVVGKGMNGEGNSGKHSGHEGQGSWTKGSGKNGGNISEKGRKGHERTSWYCERTGHMAASLTEGGWDNNLYPVYEQEQWQQQ